MKGLFDTQMGLDPQVENCCSKIFPLLNQKEWVFLSVLVSFVCQLDIA